MTWRQMPAVWRIANLQPLEKLILLSLCNHADARGFNAYPSQQRIATHCCTTTRTVRRVLRSLLDKKLISKEGKARSGVIRYRILLPLAAPAEQGANRHMAGDVGSGSPIIQHNPFNKDTTNITTKDGGDSEVQVDRFSTVDVVEPGWKASLRAQRRSTRGVGR